MDATEADTETPSTDTEAEASQDTATAEAPSATATDTEPAATDADTTQVVADAPAGDDAVPADAPAADVTVDAADDDQPEGTSDPSPEAAVGASGARPLGDASEIADRAAEAVDQMATTDVATMDATEAADAPPADDSEPADDAPADDAPPADDSEPADDTEVVAAESTGSNGASPAATAQPAPPAARVYEGPEPTTMEELLNEQATEIRSLKHGDVVEGNVVRIDKDEILVDIGAKSEGVISNRELYGRNAESQPPLNIGDQVLVYVLQPESPEGHAVLSLRRAGLERKWRAMQEQLEAGAIIEAPVIDHNKGGLIVDCGIRGFVPISQIVDFPRRPQNEQPRDAAQEIAEKLQPYVGRKLRLKILEVNRKANRLILSEKVALYEERREKRDELFSSLQVGQKVTGTVRSIAPFGVFVDLGGIDGLVHKSELSWNKVNNPESGYRVGEEVEAEVIDINHERGRISLSIRRLQPDPWHSTVADLKVGDVIDGTVTKIVNFGAFVRVRDGLEGLIHISELSHQRVAHPGDVVHEGQTLKLKIISLDQERHRLGLSLKQAEEAPARPEPTATAPRERRPRQERGYDMSQAVQEPEGGIDNTLAAAFAQVRAQIEETEAARSSGLEADEVEAAPPAEDTVDADELAGQDEATEAVNQSAEPEIAPETADAPALEVGAADVDASGEEPAAEETTPARKGRASTKAAADGDDDATGDDDVAGADEPEATAAEPEPEPTAAEPEPTTEPESEPAAESEPEATAERAVEEPPAESAGAEVPADGSAETEDPRT